MLSPNLAPAVPPTNHLIAGHRCGKRVLCTPQAKPVFDELEALSRKGNHWARLAIKGIHSLSTGRITMDNVYTKKDAAAYGRNTFYVTLPGIMATFESLTDDSFRLLTLDADKTFFEQQKNHKKPGLWRVKIDPDSKLCEVETIPGGRLSRDKTKRYVAITDRKYLSPEDAARSAARGMSKLNDTIRRSIEVDGFDLHFTPGTKIIGGLINSKEATSPETEGSLRESSQILSYTMYEARDTESVTWFSNWGGSGVLTQAMRNLNDQKVNLSNHCILMNHPTTRPGLAEALARKLELDPITDGNRGFMPSELIGRLATFDAPRSAIQRIREDDDYKFHHAVLGGSKKIFSAGDTVTGTIGLLGTAGIMTATSPLAVGAGIGGAAYFVVNKAIKLYQGRRL